MLPRSKRTVLITGGAGFIGSHLADELLLHGYQVRALDNLTPQVHGEGQKRPAWLAPEIDLLVGDIRDPEAVESALEGVDAVFHFAAAVGVGQSMYDVEHYVSVNDLGTAVLMEKMIKRKPPTIQKLVVASSMSVYGEGLCVDEKGQVVEAGTRSLEQLRRGDWELHDDRGGTLTPAPTPETKPVTLESIYALTKFDQERTCLVLGRAYGIPTTALRFFNVFGTRQALSNPYTGVLAIFASRLLNDRPPVVFEDGAQQRDFVSVHDVVRACRLALESDAAEGRVINVASGKRRTVVEIARKMAEVLGKPHIVPEIAGCYRMGDVRHCIADITLARAVLGYVPEVEFDHGLAQLAQWLRGQVAKDNVARATAELKTRGLTL
jgi:dTDP-L-rhamnose 4-epimerase